ncbi:MAG: glycosyltransferase [Planctomycetota bacterium]
MTEPVVSVIVPLRDEQDNVGPLLAELAATMPEVGEYEVVLVDDGSRDGTLAAARAWKADHAAAWLRVLRLARNAGQSAAVMAGAEAARGAILATLDGDMQNDPRDLPAMIARVRAGEVDGVFGVRRKRQDTFVRRMSSRIANRVRNWITGDAIADAACGIKVVRRSFFLRVPRFVGMHRFMATLVRYAGGRIAEVDVHHRPRAAGVAKYGIGNRMLRGLRDCFAVRWMRTRVLQHEVADES